MCIRDRVYVDPEADDATIQSVGERITATPGVSRVQYMRCV